MSFVRHIVNGVHFYTAGIDEYVQHGFSTRLGGVSEAPYDTLNLGSASYDKRVDILENYRRFTSALGLDSDSLVFTKQVHTDHVQPVTRAHRGNGYVFASKWDCDALVTNETGVTLTVFSADCVPVLLYDPVSKAIGAAHAGWRGTALGIAAKTLRTMGTLYGTRPETVQAAIGPAIGACCFETKDDVALAMRTSFGEQAMKAYITQEGESFHVDIKAINAWQLRQMGVTAVEIAPLCTCCLAEEFFSHRRNGTARGLHAAMIALPNAVET